MKLSLEGVSPNVAGIVLTRELNSCHRLTFELSGLGNVAAFANDALLKELTFGLAEGAKQGLRVFGHGMTQILYPPFCDRSSGTAPGLATLVGDAHFHLGFRGTNHATQHTLAQYVPEDRTKEPPERVERSSFLAGVLGFAQVVPSDTESDMWRTALPENGILVRRPWTSNEECVQDVCAQLRGRHNGILGWTIGRAGDQMNLAFVVDNSEGVAISDSFQAGVWRAMECYATDPITTVYRETTERLRPGDVFDVIMQQTAGESNAAGDTHVPLGRVKWRGRPFVCRRVDHVFVPDGDEFVCFTVASLGSSVGTTQLLYTLHLRGEFNGWTHDGRRVKISTFDNCGWDTHSGGPLHVAIRMPTVNRTHVDEGQYAGMYVRFQQNEEERLDVEVTSGLEPIYLGTRQMRLDTLEEWDVVLNAPRVAIASSPYSKDAASRTGLDVTQAEIRLTADEKVVAGEDLEVKADADIRGEETRVHGNLKIATD